MTQPLTDLLLELLAMPCVTGDEGPIAEWLAKRYAGEEVTRVGHSLVVGPHDPTRPTVLLVGHTDVVPPTPVDRKPRVEGEYVVGRGASDMKAGLAVAMDCFEDAALRQGPYALRLVAYAGEEGPHSGNELGDVLASVEGLDQADLAVVLEPTDLAVQLGCLGVLNAHVAVRGRAAHAARPWHGQSAITNAIPLLEELGALQPRDVELDGLVFREVLTVTQAWTENTRNVVPPTLNLNLNYRFTPDLSVEQAEKALVSAVAGRGEVAIVDRAPAASPQRDSPLVEGFVEAAGHEVEAKQAWTDVARFAECGVPALNYGPGLTAQAHQAGEHVPTANLAKARSVLAHFLEATG